MDEERLNQVQGGEARKDYMLPLSIVAAALLISGSWIYTSNIKTPSDKPVGDGGKESLASVIREMKPVGPDDHILGNPDAPVKIVEYSDLECPFCKSFHATMKQVMKEYGTSGKVAWIYRHFPLERLHPKAFKEAEAAECAAELGGNEKFWIYIDRIFQATPSNNGLDLAQLPIIAKAVGLDENKFNECLSSGKYMGKIAASIEDAAAAGAEGTPYSVVMGKNGEKTPVGGDLPFVNLRIAIEEALK